MKILIIRSYPSYMAVTNRTYNIQELGLAKALVRKGHICDILFWTDKEEKVVEVPCNDNGKIRVYYKKGTTFLKNTIYRNCQHLFETYDVLQASEYNQLQSWYLARKYPKKTIIYHGPYYCTFNRRYNAICKIFDALFLKLYIRNNTRFLTKSEKAKDFLARKGIRKSYIKTVGVGLDEYALTSAEELCEEPLLREMKAHPENIKLLYIGQFEKRRNMPFLLDVLKQISKKNNIKLYLIGTGKENYIKAFFSYANQMGLQDKIVWQKRIPQKYLSQIYKEADFFLLPTEYEIFGMVLLEAMYFGKVVLTTENGGSSMLIKDGENGIIITEKKTDVWADKLLMLIEDKATCTRLGKNAAESIKQRFTWDKISDMFIEAYSDMLESGDN